MVFFRIGGFTIGGGYVMLPMMQKEGALAATLEGGHTIRRILHIDGDQTGKGIMDALREQLVHQKHIHSSHQCHLLSLINEENVVKGVIYMKDHEIFHHYGNSIVLATGGLGNLYKQTTNHTGAIGTGIAFSLAVFGTYTSFNVIGSRPV